MVYSIDEKSECNFIEIMTPLFPFKENSTYFWHFSTKDFFYVCTIVINYYLYKLLINVENFKHMNEILKYLLHVIITFFISFPKYKYFSFYSNTLILTLLYIFVFILVCLTRKTVFLQVYFGSKILIDNFCYWLIWIQL